MTQAQTKPLNFADFLEIDQADIRYELLADGSLIALPSEADINRGKPLRHLALRQSLK